jgi:spore maturation protein CgeB
MKILIVGSDHVSAMEQYYTKYLSEAGISNVLFPAQGIFYKYYNASILNKVLFKLGLSSIYSKINQQLLEAVAKEKPTVILAFKGMEIFPATWKQLREQKIKLVNYNPDNPFLFSGPGSGNKNITNSIPLFDLHLTYDKSIREKMEKQYGRPAACIPFGYDIPDELLAECESEEEILKACFLGNPDQPRSEFLNSLAAGGITIDVYGSNWNRHKLHPNISDRGPVYGRDFWKVLRKYRVQLNFMRPHNPNSHNMRTFEVAGVGGIGLFPATEDHKAFFEKNSEIFLYNNTQDCIEQARHILQMPAAAAMEVRRKIRQRSERDGYSYKHHVQSFIELIRKLNAN